MLTIRQAEASEMNKWLTSVHYLHRPVIRSKMLGYEVVNNDQRIGGVLWATPPFTKARGLIGYPGCFDKWECLILARFYMTPGTSNLVQPSSILRQVMGKRGNSKSFRKAGWRLQEDWVLRHPPVYPENPFVPRILISWSDLALEHIPKCEVCGQEHFGEHKGTIYKASGWTLDGISKSSGRRTVWMEEGNRMSGSKLRWVLRLPPNAKAHRLGLEVA